MFLANVTVFPAAGNIRGIIRWKKTRNKHVHVVTMKADADTPHAPLPLIVSVVSAAAVYSVSCIIKDSKFCKQCF